VRACADDRGETKDGEAEEQLACVPYRPTAMNVGFHE
jgi:hypothetical protein